MIPFSVRVRLTVGLLGAAGCLGRPEAVPAAALCDGGNCDFSWVVQGIDSAVAAEAAPGVVVAISRGGARWYHGAGRLGVDIEKPVGPESVYDLASLTKVISLTTLTMIAVAERRIQLDDPVVHYLPDFTGPDKDKVTIRHLLTHSSGLRPHRALWQEATSRTDAFRLVNGTPLDTAPGIQARYSDLGAMVLTQIIEKVYRKRIDQLFDRRVADPLDLGNTRYRPPKKWRRRIAPTERDPWRGRVLQGEVHDENAAFMDGVSGHAGLFSTAADLLTFGEWILDARNGKRTKLKIPADVIRAFTTRQDLVPGSSRALGWDTPSPENSSAGTLMSAESFGHTGFTGTSIWIDPTRSLVLVILSNRINPSRENGRFNPLRPLVADRVVEAIERHGGSR